MKAPRTAQVSAASAAVASPWFAVDKEGLAKLLARRGKHWAAAEVLQNAWDAPGTTRVDLTMVPRPGGPYVDLRIEDDSPEGFTHLEHAFTLFAESTKKADPTLRGRFNLGEKLVLALATEASLSTTTGTVTFGAGGRIVNRRRRRARGSVFEACLQMTRAEYEEALAAIQTYLPPAGIETRVNGARLAQRASLASAPVTLATEVADDQGILRRVRRATMIAIHAPVAGHPARLYEMGIPVMDLPDDSYDVDVAQKVPLSLERDSVSPAYLRDVRVAVLNRMADRIDAGAATASWVGDALASPAIADEAVRAVIAQRFGDTAVAYDPSDAEANHQAVAKGYTVVAGGSFNAAQWSQIRRAAALPAAGQVTPTPRPFSADGAPARLAIRDDAMTAFAAWLTPFAFAMLETPVHVEFLQDFNAAACYGSHQIAFNVRRLGRAWFKGPLCERHLSLVIHELAHEYAGNHLSEAYYDALSTLGARAALLALERPDLYRMEPPA